jgi:hypothetical protein
VSWLALLLVRFVTFTQDAIISSCDAQHAINSNYEDSLLIPLRSDFRVPYRLQCTGKASLVWTTRHRPVSPSTTATTVCIQQLSHSTLCTISGRCVPSVHFAGSILPSGIGNMPCCLVCLDMIMLGCGCRFQILRSRAA